MQEPFRSCHRKSVNTLLLLLSLFFVAADAAARQGAPGPLVPDSFQLHEAAQRALEAEWLTDEERAKLRVFHGVWDDRDLISPALRAQVALNAWHFDDPLLSDEQVPVEVRAEARLHQGRFDEAIELLGEAESPRASRIRASVWEHLGQYENAAQSLEPLVRLLQQQRVEEAADLTEAVRALAIRARIEGQPARDYHTMLSLLGRAHQELDRLYWPAKLAEAELLLEKHDKRDAGAALHETLQLNPRSAQAWYDLGLLALDLFDFDGAQAAIRSLRLIAPRHPLAEMLYAEMRLVQNDPDEAMTVLNELLEREPTLWHARALRAAATSLLYEPQRTQEALAEYDEAIPGNAQALYQVGRFLAMFRQYEEAAAMLEEAIRRQPRWPAPQIELGLMEMQAGRDSRARAVLDEVVELDPFNKRAANSLLLLEQIATYAERETEHFIIRYEPGVDEVLVDLMPDALERIHEVVSARFGWKTDQKTIIEVMPDHKRFAVRITGMPHIHTIAACTGPIIALEAPREGPRTLHHGTFDWRRVLQHEYTHTITLDQTQFRIPHWLTEAAAVSMEMAPRDYDDCVMLARSYRGGTLFDLDAIKWAFVRPRKPEDRGKAYTQGHWMVEFMNERFGEDALVRLLERYFEGEREAEAISNVLGISRDDFFRQFLEWAGDEVKAWGLLPEPSWTDLCDELRWADPELAEVMATSRKARMDVIAQEIADRIGRPSRLRDRPFTADQWPPLMRPPVDVSDEQLGRWREQYPDHPDVLREQLKRMEEAGGSDEEQIALLERYAQLRPVDPFPHRRLALIYQELEQPEKEIVHLEQLDAREQKSPIYAWRLATLYRALGDPETAMARITRAVQIDAYDASHRELAAEIALEAGYLETARMHIKALTLLEPDRDRHHKRLERIDELLASRQ